MICFKVSSITHAYIYLMVSSAIVESLYFSNAPLIVRVSLSARYAVDQSKIVDDNAVLKQQVAAIRLF